MKSVALLINLINGIFKMLNSKDILDKYWNRCFPIDIISIANNIIVQIKNKNYKISVQPITEKSVSGRCFFDGNKFICQYNINEHRLRQRFVVAHELGHIACDHINSNKIKIDDINTKYDSDEIEANKFATSILMPEDSVRHYHYGFASITALSNVFDVSEIAMRNRLDSLSLVY